MMALLSYRPSRSSTTCTRTTALLLVHLLLIQYQNMMASTMFVSSFVPKSLYTPIFYTPPVSSSSRRRTTAHSDDTSMCDALEDVTTPPPILHNRRTFFGSTLMSCGLIIPVTTMTTLFPSQPVYGQVFFDPAQYGDQELRVGAVDSVRESVRRAILQNPTLAPAFYQLALLDGLSYNAQTKAFGPDGKVVIAVLTSKQTDTYTTNLQTACLALIEAEKSLRKKTAISLADAVAIAGAEAIESIGGPVLPVQLGRADTPKDGILPNVPIDLLAGTRPLSQVTAAFANAGLTEREMTALLSGLLTLELVEKTRTADDWKQSTRPKFREAGKMGRMSEYKPVTDDDIAQAALEADPDYVSGDDDWYIADSFGTRDDRFGQRLGKDDINEKNFNKYLKELQVLNKKGSSTTTVANDNGGDEYGWIAKLLLDPSLPTVQTWWTKYAGTNLAYIKDLTIAYNSVTQLGAVYTGGKYENLLKNRPRKSLNNDDLNLF
jgi:Peroxidase